MKDKTYKQRTKFFGIPVVGDGDGVWPEVELRKYQIIENLLVAGLKGMKSCIFDEGDMTLEKRQDGSFSAVMRPSGNAPALEGIAGNAYFLVSDAIVWDNLQAGKIYYLYATRTPHTFSDASSLRAFASEYEQGKLSVLVGIADLRASKPCVNRNPSGKVVIDDLMEHPLQGENPHGKSLIQDEIIVRKSLVLGDGEDMNVTLRSGKEKVTVPIACLVPSAKVFVTKGMEGVIVTSSARVAFVQASRVSGSLGKTGEISIGYFGQDAKVPDENSFVIYNDGDSDITMRALIYHG
jgi:hypothetical protein